VVPDEQLSLAIGRRGQNVRLASMLTGWAIDILTEAEESERRQQEFKERSQVFVDALDVDDVIAGLLVTEGFTTVDEVAAVELEDLANIEGFDEGVAGELKTRAEAFVAKEYERLEAERLRLGVVEAVADATGFGPALLVKLGEKGVKTLDDLGDLAGDELVEIVGKDTLDEEAANAIIMKAREHWFADEKK
jgi:N utilization substance protein A